MGDTLKYTPKPLKSLDQLNSEELNAYITEQISLGNLPKNWRYAQANRLYRNQEFKKKFGDNIWKRVTNKTSNTYMPAEMRDEYYDRQEYLQGIRDRYGNDPDVANYLNYTTEGLKDLWESDILSNTELEAEEKRIRSIYEPSEKNVGKQNKFLSNFINAARETDMRRGTVGAKKTAVSAAASLRGILPEEEEAALTEKLEYENKVNELKQKGYITEGLDYEHMKSSINNLYSQNQKKKEDLRRREDTRILNLPRVQSAASNMVQSIYDDINAGKLTYEEALKRFDEIFDNDLKDTPSGSRYYTGYKNRKELANLSAEDKFRALAKFIVLSDTLGDPARAMEIVDTEFFNIGKANQSWWKRRSNVLIGTGAKANSMIANELLTPVELYHAVFDNAEQYKVYKTAEEALNSKGAGFMLNPNYWNYVDQYAVWDPSEIQRINHNGGIGGRQNLYSPTGKMTAEQFADEGFKMLGYMLPAVALSAVTRNVPRTSGWAKAISWGERIGSAAALGSAYSTGAYSDINLKGEQALDAMFNEEAGDFVKQYYQKNPNFIANYLKERGIKESDNEIIKVPAIMAAEKELYDRAKEAYFNADDAKGGNRRKVYKEAYEQLLKDAKIGAVADYSLETARMIASGSFWGKWTKSKLTRDIVGGKTTPIKMVGEEAKQALSKNALRRKAATETVLIGGIDNWLDDLTVGAGVGLGLGDFNNHIAKQYDPEAFIEGAKMSSNILDGLYWGTKGVEEAFYNPQTWIDGALGAAGSILGARVNAVTLIHDIIKKDGWFSNRNNDTEANKKWKDLSAWQHINRYFTNGVIQSIADSDERFDNTNKFLEDFNAKTLPRFQEDIQKVGNIIKEDIDFNEIADSILEGKDLKQRGMLESAIRMQAAYKDPVLSQIPKVQEFADFLKRGEKGQFSFNEIQEYINDPNNIKVKNSDNAEALAREALQKNVNNFLAISDTYNKLFEKVAKDSQRGVLNDFGRTQLAVQLTLKDLWKKRLAEMQSTLGTAGTEKAKWDFGAEFGSEKGKQQALDALVEIRNKQLSDSIKYGKEAQRIREKLEGLADEKLQNKLKEDYTIAEFARTYYEEAAKETADLIEEREKAKVSFDENGYARTFSEEEIMHLSPKQRAAMLDPKNAIKYSKEQRGIINSLSDKLKYHTESESTADLLQMVFDAGAVQDRIAASDKSILKVYKNPDMLSKYIERVKERQATMLLRAASEALREDQLSRIDAIESAQEAVDVIFRGKAQDGSISKGFYITADVVKEYLEKHPEASEKLSEAYKMVQTLDDFFLAADSLFEEKEAIPIKEAVTKAINSANSQQEIMSAVESLVDDQTDSAAKMQFDRLLEKMKSLGYQRDATKLRSREKEQKRKQAAELKKQRAEAKKDGKNFDWNGYKVGDTVYNKETGIQGTVSSFKELEDGTNEMVVASREEGKFKYTRYNSATEKNKVSKEPVVTTPKNADAPEGAAQVINDTAIGNHQESVSTQISAEDVVFDTDTEGNPISPSAEKQAVAEGTSAQEVPAEDPTDQGNSVATNDDIISGNRWVTYSVSSLKDGVIKEEVPENPNSIFGKIVEWLHNNNIKLQEIIDEEFGRIITDNPDTEIRFMMMKEQVEKGPLHKVLFNVIELTPAIRNKYHKEERGGVIQANGKSWLVVGTTGFDGTGTDTQRVAYDRMRVPITKRMTTYFNSNSTERYYVDPIAHSKVQNTTSGRIVTQKLGEEAPRLRKVSELVADAGQTLRQAAFGVQTKQAGNKGFATTRNLDSDAKVFPPRNVEDNRGRTFLMIDTANGNKIPAMIEPTMYKDLPADSRLKDLINSTIAKLFSTNYETRAKAIRELCGYLVLGGEKNILVDTKGVNVLTIKREGFPDSVYKLGENFDAVKFLNDVERANFQVNIALRSLNDIEMVKIYDEAGALMTRATSMRTAGMSYNIYMTDAAGKPIIITPVGNAVPGIGRKASEPTVTSIINNTLYEYKRGRWINRSTQEKVTPGSALETSCIYNNTIREGQMTPYVVRKGEQYFLFQNEEGSLFFAVRDADNNVRLLSVEESAPIYEEVKNKADEETRAKNLEDVDFGEETEAPASSEQETQLTPEQIQQQILGNFEAPAQPEITTQPEKLQQQKEVIKEAKETPSQQPKEVISGVGTKSLTELQNTGKLSTFVEIFANSKVRKELYGVLREKDWGINGKRDHDMKILEDHNIPIVGIEDVKDWINLIKDCR